MFTEPTMDATRRMLLNRNQVDSDEERLPLEDLDTWMRECTEDNMGTYLVTKPQRQESLQSLLNTPSILRTRKRRRISSWFLSSGHHPRLPLLALSKYYNVYHIIKVKDTMVIFLSNYNNHLKLIGCTFTYSKFYLMFPLVLLALTPTPGQFRTVVLEGTQTSYAQYRQWHGGGANCSLELEFRTSRPDGLLLYTDNRDLHEYMQLKLVNGGVNLRFNWGDGAHVLSGIRLLYRYIRKCTFVKSSSL